MTSCARALVAVLGMLAALAAYARAPVAAASAHASAAVVYRAAAETAHAVVARLDDRALTRAPRGERARPPGLDGVPFGAVARAAAITVGEAPLAGRELAPAAHPRLHARDDRRAFRARGPPTT